jgi:hypothetical protein
MHGPRSGPPVNSPAADPLVAIDGGPAFPSERD